jgi:acyl-coenzyme A synthetase/AMP-(fatty) acid ligase
MTDVLSRIADHRPSGINDISSWRYAVSVAELTGCALHQSSFTECLLINRCYAETTIMSRSPATTFEYLQFHAASTPDRVALIMDDGEYTYGRFADDALRFTKALADLGIERRQIVSIHHPHFYIEWLLTIACENLGAVSVSDDARNWKRANYLYQHVDVGLTNTPADEEPSFQYHCLTDDWVRATLRMDLAIAQKQPVIVPELDDLVRITRSSGSTDAPKLIPLTRNVQNHRQGDDIRFGLIHTDSIVLIIGVGFIINGNLLLCSACCQVGATVIRSRLPAKAIHDHKVNFTMGLPLALNQLLNDYRKGSLSKSNMIIEVGGAALSGSLRDELYSVISERLFNRLGTNEATTILLMKDHEIGFVTPGTKLEIHDEQHRPVPDGTPGLISVRTPGMIEGYYKNEEETRKRFHTGWFYTGDAGIMVGPRKVKLLGRADDMVIMGGVNESPLVLEDTLRNGAGVKDAAVVGIKASDGGDLVCVALVLTDDANVEAIRAGIHKLWAVYRVRIIIAVVDDLARTENGKVSRAKVRDFFRDQLEAEVAAS